MRGWLRRVGGRSLRVRTTALAVSVVGVALVIGGVTLVGLLRNSLTDQVRTAATLRAEDVAGVLEAGTSPARLAVSDEEDLVIQVIDAAGQVVASSENVHGEPPLADLAPGRSTQIDGSPVGDHAFLLVAREVDATTGRFTLLVGRSTEVVADSTGLVVSVLTGGLPVLLLLVGLTTWRSVGRTLSSVEAIRREVEEISARELHRRVPGTEGNDEIARLGETMNRMLDRLEASHDQQQRFVSDASHELRSPVATIRQHAEVALAHPGQTSAEELASIVLAEDLRVQRLVEDLLLLARASVRRAVDLDDGVFEEAQRLQATTPLNVDVSRVSGGRVDGDPGQLRRILRNLSDNAARHAIAQVRFTLREDDDRVLLTVEDDGAGVPVSDRARIFERFVRLDSARSRDAGGSGLGLAIVAEVAAAHGGSVSVQDSTLGGARFELELPRSTDR